MPTQRNWYWERNRCSGPILLNATMLCEQYQRYGSGTAGLVTVGLNTVSHLIEPGSTLRFVRGADKLELKVQWLAEGRNLCPRLPAATWGSRHLSVGLSALSWAGTHPCKHVSCGVTTLLSSLFMSLCSVPLLACSELWLFQSHRGLDFCWWCRCPSHQVVWKCRCLRSAGLGDCYFDSGVILVSGWPGDNSE